MKLRVALLGALLLGAGCLPVNRNPDVLHLVGAGDIASCGEHADEYTGDLLGSRPGKAWALGDMEYDNGNWTCYNQAWGEDDSRMHPMIGNHENADAFLTKWNSTGMHNFDSVGNLDGGYYYFHVGPCRVFVLNSEFNISASATFLRNNADGRACQIAAWHHPYVSDGELGQLPTSDPRYADITKVRPLWTAAYDTGVDLVVNGHDHDYQRFTKLGRDGEYVGPGSRGVREIVVGTGGRHLNRYFPNGLHPASRAYDPNAYGILDLDFHRVSGENTVEFEFLSISTGDARESNFHDAGEFTL